MNCSQCGHSEEDHGPMSGRWVGGEVIHGRWCYLFENLGYQEDLCPCSGYNKEPAGTYVETLLAKTGATP